MRFKFEWNKNLQNSTEMCELRHVLTSETIEHLSS